MSVKHCFILVEGQQDILFIGRLIQSLGVPSVENVEQISSVWSPLIDTSRLTEHRGRLKTGSSGLPMHVLFSGACFQSEQHSVVIQKAGGRGTLFRRTLQSMNTLLDGGLQGLGAVGLIPDSDDDPTAIRQSCEQILKDTSLLTPIRPANVAYGKPNTGIYTLPRPTDCGATEDLMLDCAQLIYPTLHAAAIQFVDSVEKTCPPFEAVDLMEINSPHGRSKAVVGCISSFLRPGSTIQVSILRDRWVSRNTVSLPRIQELVSFLKSLCELA